MKDNYLSITPVENYKVPEMPVYGDENPALLKKLPSRWRKSAKVLASLGLIGTLALSGCASANGTVYPYPPARPYNSIVHNLGLAQGSYSGYSESNLLVRLHSGGGGGSVYVVHLTEQEAFGVIRERLESAGLVFGDTVPDYTVSNFFIRDRDELGLKLYDAEKGVAITHVSWLGPNTIWNPHVSQLAVWVADSFAQYESDIAIGVFYNPGRVVPHGHLLSRPSRRNVSAARPIIRRQLINQADVFIARLQSDGILERYSDIHVIINGVPVHFSEYPIIVNNHKMVPAHEIFELLGMEVYTYDEELSNEIFATKGDILINIWEFPSGLYELAINFVGPECYIPMFAHNDTVLVPLQFIANTVGADVEWNEETQTMTITTN